MDDPHFYTSEAGCSWSWLTNSVRLLATDESVPRDVCSMLPNRMFLDSTDHVAIQFNPRMGSLVHRPPPRSVCCQRSYRNETGLDLLDKHETRNCCRHPNLKIVALCILLHHHLCVRQEQPTSLRGISWKNQQSDF